MKLYKLPSTHDGTKIRLISDVTVPPDHRNFDDKEILTFYHIDGMYSYCKDCNDNVVHLVAWAEVEIVE